MKLREYLDSEGIQYKKFAVKIGISEPTIHKLLKEDADPSLSTMLLIQKLTRGNVKISDWVKQYKEGKEKEDES